MEAAGKTFRLRFRSLSRLFLLRLLSDNQEWSLQDKFDEEAKRQRVAEFIVEPKPQLQVVGGWSEDALLALLIQSQQGIV